MKGKTVLLLPVVALMLVAGNASLYASSWSISASSLEGINQNIIGVAVTQSGTVGILFGPIMSGGDETYDELRLLVISTEDGEVLHNEVIETDCADELNIWYGYYSHNPLTPSLHGGFLYYLYRDRSIKELNADLELVQETRCLTNCPNRLLTSINAGGYVVPSFNQIIILNDNLGIRSVIEDSDNGYTIELNGNLIICGGGYLAERIDLSCIDISSGNVTWTQRIPVPSPYNEQVISFAAMRDGIQLISTRGVPVEPYRDRVSADSTILRIIDPETGQFQQESYQFIGNNYIAVSAFDKELMYNTFMEHIELVTYNGNFQITLPDSDQYDIPTWIFLCLTEDGVLLFDYSENVFVHLNNTLELPSDL
ncbi:MAG: hypothetical protein KAR44_12565 [Candidatus Aegiribacteria sp.]|nr:hypothetical protein [Candidatus Aegiribacteria sp.]